MPPLISIENLTMRYPLKEGGVNSVFESLNLDIREGEFVTLLGQTGCGKSTLLKLLLGSEKATVGVLKLNGTPITGPNRDRGYVPQKYSLFPDKTVVQNIAFGPMAESFAIYRLLQPAWWHERNRIYAEAMHYLRRVGLSDRDANKYPDQLSGGMQQRVAIAQSLIMKPRVLLMDESFSALDPGTRTAMQRMLRQIWQDQHMTVVFVTHNIAEAVILGSRVILLAKNEALHHSEVALDLTVPEYIRRADGMPRTEELERLIREIDRAGDRQHPLAEPVAELAS